MDLFNSIIPNWWSENSRARRRLARRGWWTGCGWRTVCQQHERAADRVDAARVSRADPVWSRRGCRTLTRTCSRTGSADALYAIVDQMYGWGFSLPVRDRHVRGRVPADVDGAGSSRVNIRLRTGRASTSWARSCWTPRRIVQIDRNPTRGGRTARRRSRSFAQLAWGLLAAGNQSMSVTQGGIPQAV